MNAFNWKMTLTATALSLAATGLATTALADARDPAEKAGYEAAVRSASEANANGRAYTPVIEGRNAYVDERPAAPLEPYIRQSIEMNQRSAR